MISPKLFTLVLSFDRLGGLTLEVSVPVDKPPFKVPTYVLTDTQSKFINVVYVRMAKHATRHEQKWTHSRKLAQL